MTLRAPTLALHLTRTVGGAIAAAFAALAMLGLAIDLMESAGTALAFGGLPAVLRYALLALPGILAAVAPVALLAGSILGFALLARRQEAVVLRAAGLSAARLLVLLLPLALALGAALHLLVDRAVPASETALGAGFGGAFAERAAGDPVWLRAPGWVVTARPVGTGGDRLAALTVYELDPAGILARRIDAPEARHEDGVWRLAAATVTETAAAERGETPGPAAPLDWRSTLAPADLRALLAGQETVSRDSALAASAGDRPRLRAGSFYETTAARALSVALVPLALLLVAAPVALAAGRTAGTLARAAALAAALGVAFVIGDGTAATLGEKGLIPPAAAAWAPVLLAATLGAWTLLRAEG